jgi:isopentenyl-diphosphate delta-isomerase
VPHTNLDEVEDWKFVDIASLRHDLELHPDTYTEWFKLIMNHRELREIPV